MPFFFGKVGSQNGIVESVQIDWHRVVTLVVVPSLKEGQILYVLVISFLGPFEHNENQEEFIKPTTLLTPLLRSLTAAY